MIPHSPPGDADDPAPRDQADARDDLRSFGRRRGRKLSPRQSQLLEDVLPRVRVPLEGAPPEDLGELFQARGAKVREVWLEIGFGGAEHLIWQAERNPGIGLIGCEPFEEGGVKALAGIEAGRLGNVLIHPDDARPLLRWLPDASLGRAFVLFPDPWPKKRHVKRRLVNPGTLAMLARVLRPGAELRIATDIGDYARTILIALQSQRDLVWTARSAADWRQGPDARPPTRYEAKASREGRRAMFLTLMRR